MTYRFVDLRLETELQEWNTAEEPVRGSREKMTLIRPDDAAYFIFKLPKDRREHQIWSELVASFIAGDLLGWEVQHVQIGVLNGRPGSLLAYVYEPGSKRGEQEVFFEGEDLCAEVMPTFDRRRGDDHTLGILEKVYEKILGPCDGMARADFLDFWARAIAFDTLISNTDRHAENWAVIRSTAATRMAPLYDNATSMGCNMEARGLLRQFRADGAINDAKLASFAQSGCHHLRARGSATKGTQFEELCGAFLALYPEGRCWFEAIAEIDLEPVSELLARIADIKCLDEPYALCDERRMHIMAILHIGRERIKNVLQLGQTR